MSHAAATGVFTALAGARLERLTWLFLAAAGLGLFCDHAAQAGCAPPAGLSYEASRMRRETTHAWVDPLEYGKDNRGSALV
jgi:hypothetical protein